MVSVAIRSCNSFYITFFKVSKLCILAAVSERSTSHTNLPIRDVSALKVLKSQLRGSFRDIVLNS